MSLVAAGLLAVVGYSWTAPPRAEQSPAGLWNWLVHDQQSWDPMATLAVLAGVVLPLFLATQVGNATHGAGASAAHSAKVVGIENITNVACWVAATISWLALPSVAAVQQAAFVNLIVAVAAPVLFSFLWAVSEPSDESHRLERERAEVRDAEMDRVLRDFDELLRRPDGTVPGRGRSGRALRRAVTIDGSIHGFLAGAAVALPGMLGSSAIMAQVIVWALVALVFAGVYEVAVRFLVDEEATRLIDGGVSVFVTRLTGLFWGTLGLMIGTLLALDALWLVALGWLLVTVGPFALARLQRRSATMQASVYRTVRRRTAAARRADRRRKERDLDPHVVSGGEPEAGL